MPEIHDKFRGTPGALDRALQGIDYLSKHSKITLGISSVLTSDYIESFPETIEFFLKRPIHLILIKPIGVWTEDLPVERWHIYKYWINNIDALDR